MPENRILSASQALERLRAGNHRYVSEMFHSKKRVGRSRRIELVDGQAPFAIILGCSDSRVPAEFVFDQGLGDLFVIRVAGNIVAPSQIGSVEFAGERFGTRLVVVLGHSMCGAVVATVDALERPDENRSRNLGSIVDRIRPVVDTLVEVGDQSDRSTLITHAIRANIRNSVDHLRHGSQILEKRIDTDGLMIVGAEYSLETGTVEFFLNS
jgi:carbonic anhydrase